MTGYCVSLSSLATRVGELNAVADQVGTIVAAIDLTGGDFGPGDISAAVAEVADEWRGNLGDMRDKIGKTSENLRTAVSNYATAEQDGEDAMLALGRGAVRDAVFQTLKGARP